MNPNPFRPEPLPARPQPERADTLAGLTFFAGCAAEILAALVWGSEWPAAAAVTAFAAGFGALLFCAAFTWARFAGYEARRLEEWERVKWQRS